MKDIKNIIKMKSYKYYKNKTLIKKENIIKK